MEKFWYKIKEFSRSIYNFWVFRKEIWNFRSWDYNFNLELFEKSLLETERYIRKEGIHVGKKESADNILKFIELGKEVGYEDYSEDLKNISDKLWSDNFMDNWVPSDKEGFYQLKLNDISPEEEKRYEVLLKKYNKWEQQRHIDRFNLLRDNIQKWWD